MMTRSLPPLCPICAGPTRIKMTHKLAEPNEVMCIFFCPTCALEYPVAVKTTEVNPGSAPDAGAGLD